MYLITPWIDQTTTTMKEVPEIKHNTGNPTMRTAAQTCS
jgi:hypothetical protein